MADINTTGTTSAANAPVVIDLAFNVNEQNVLSVISDVLKKADKMSEQGLDINFNTEGLEKSLTQLFDGKKFKDVKIGTEGIEQGINDAANQMSKVLTQAYSNAQTKLQTAFQAYNKKKSTFADAQGYRDALQEVNNIVKLIQAIDPNKIFETINLDGKKLINIDEKGIDEAFKEVTTSIQKNFKEAQKQAEVGLKAGDLEKQLTAKKEEIRKTFTEIGEIVRKNGIIQTGDDDNEYFDFSKTDSKLTESIKSRFTEAIGMMQDYGKLYQEAYKKAWSFDTKNETFSNLLGDKKKNENRQRPFTKDNIRQMFKTINGAELSDKYLVGTQGDVTDTFKQIKEETKETTAEIARLKKELKEALKEGTSSNILSAADGYLEDVERSDEATDAFINKLMRLKELMYETGSKNEFNQFTTDTFNGKFNEFVKGYEAYNTHFNRTPISSNSGSGNGEGSGTGSGSGGAVTDEDVVNAENLSKIDFNTAELGKYLSTLQEISPILNEVKKTTVELSASIETLSQDLSESSFTNFTKALDAVKKSYDTLVSSFKEESGLEARIGEIKQLFETGLKNIDFNVEEVAKKISTGTQKELLNNKLTVYINEIQFAENALDNFVTDAQNKLDAEVQTLNAKVNLIADGNVKADNLTVQLPVDDNASTQENVNTAKEELNIQKEITEEEKKQAEIINKEADKKSEVVAPTAEAPVEDAKTVLSTEKQIENIITDITAQVEKIYGLEENIYNGTVKRKEGTQEIFKTYQELIPLFEQLQQLSPNFDYSQGMGDYAPEAMKANISEVANERIKESNAYKKIIAAKKEYNKLEKIDGSTLPNDKRIARLEKQKELQQYIISNVERINKTEIASSTDFNADNLINFNKSIDDIDYSLGKIQERIANLKSSVSGNSSALLKKVESQINTWNSKSRTGNLGKKSLEAYDDLYEEIMASQTVEQYANNLPPVGTRLVDEATVNQALKLLETFRSEYDATGKKIQEVAVKTTEETQAVKANTEAKQANVQANTQVGNTENNISSPIVNNENLNTVFEGKEINTPINVKNNLASDNTLKKAQNITNEIIDTVNAIELEIEAYNNVSKVAELSSQKQVKSIHSIGEEVNKLKSELDKLDITITQVYGNKEVQMNQVAQLENVVSGIETSSAPPTTAKSQSKNVDISNRNNNSTDIAGGTKKESKKLADLASAEQGKYNEKAKEVTNNNQKNLKIETARAQILQKISDIYGDIVTKTKNAQPITSDMQNLDAAMQANDEIAASAKKATIAYNGAEKAIKNINDSIRNLKTSSVDKNSSEYAGILSSLEKQKADYKVILSKLKTKTDGSNINELVSRFVKLETETEKCNVRMKDLKKTFSSTVSTEKLSKNYSALIAKMEAFAQKNSKFLSDEGLSKKYNNILSQASDSNLYNPAHLTNIQKQFEQLQATVISTNQAGYSLKDTMIFLFEKIGGKALIGGAISYVQTGLRQILSTVKEIDSAITDLKKVSTETQTVYNSFLKSAGNTAKELGSTMSELISSTSDFARLGYNVQEAASLAQNAIMYSNVGDLDIETATSDLVSTTKAFGLATNQVESIVDKFNEVGNRFAVDSKGLGEGLQNSASALAVAGNSLDESIALITGGAEIIQDSGEMGAALKILSLRLRGMSTSLSDMGEETEGVIINTSKLQDKIKGLTAINGNEGFDIMADADNFKSTYKIMQGIAEVWDDLTDSSRASLLEIIAGRRIYQNM